MEHDDWFHPHGQIIPHDNARNGSEFLYEGNVCLIIYPPKQTESVVEEQREHKKLR